MAIAAMFCTVNMSHAGKYVYPLKDVPEAYTSSFAEFRMTHFHGGVDLKTDGTVGKPVVSIADGYISRVVRNHSGGYGLLMYVTHPSTGEMSVYGHLRSFRKDVETYVQRERLKRQTNILDFSPDPGLFPVRAGDVIAYSGNSGASHGPHLHIELLSADGKFVKNPIRAGVLSPRDTIPPRILHLFYVAVDSVRGVPVTSPTRTYELVRDKGVYRPTKSVELDRNGYFVVTVKDLRNDTYSRFGIYRAAQWVDSRKNFEYRQDGFPKEDIHMSASVAYYPIQRVAKSEAVRMACTENSPSYMYHSVRDRGTVRCTDGKPHFIRMEFEDEAGNVSRLEFTGHPVSEQHRFHAVDKGGNDVVAGHLPHTMVRCGALTVDVPSRAVVEPLFFHISEHDGGDSTLVTLSKVYRILDSSTPLQSDVALSFLVDVEESMRKHVAVGYRPVQGALRFVKAEYSDGCIRSRIRRTGEVVAVADMTPPVVEPMFKGVPVLSGTGVLRFRIRDNFSGIASYNAEIDGRWMPLDLSYSTAACRVDQRIPVSHSRHAVRIEAIDGCGNTTVWEGEFVK